MFVQFFWWINEGNRLKRNRLLADTRREWGLEPQFSVSICNKFLESGDDPTYATVTEYSRVRYSTSRFLRLADKSRKTLNAVGRKPNTRLSSSAITKRRVTARPKFKKHRSVAKVRLAPKPTNPATGGEDERMTVGKGNGVAGFASGFSSLSNGDVDVTGLEELPSDSGEIRRGRRRKVRPLGSYEPFFSYCVIKRKHEDGELPEPPERLKLVIKPRPRGDKSPKAKRNTRKRVGELQGAVGPTVEDDGVPDPPELLRRSVSNLNGLDVASGGPLIPEPGVLPRPTCSVDADERVPKGQGGTKTKSARKSRSSGLNMSSRSTDASQTLGKATEGGVITEPDQVMDHAVAGVHETHADRRQSIPPYTFDNVGEEVPEDEDDLYNCILSEHPIFSSIGSEKEKNVSVSSRSPLPVTPPIWAQVWRIICDKDVCHMVPSLDRKCASPLTTSGATKVASIIPMILSKDIFLGPTPPGQYIR